MRRTLICETVTAATMPELVARRDAVIADMVELRLDGVAELDVAQALRGCQRPAVVTCRPVWEGGLFTGAEDQRLRILAEALAAGAEYVDVEWKAAFDDLVRGHASRVVLSSHDFVEGGSQDVIAKSRLLRSAGAAVIKVAIAARRLSDALPLVDAAAAGDAVVVAMGDAGLSSRILASRFGSRWTYAGNAVAAGQIPAARMVDEFRFRTIGPATRLFGVVGANAVRSRMPGVINEAFAAAAMDAVCVPLCAADAQDLTTFTEALGFDGVIEDGLPQDETDRQVRAWTGLRCA